MGAGYNKKAGEGWEGDTAEKKTVSWTGFEI